MTQEELQNYQIKHLTDALDELRRANSHQMDFNKEVIKFMATVSTWGKVGLLLWTVFAALLVWAITNSG